MLFWIAQNDQEPLVSWTVKGLSKWVELLNIFSYVGKEVGNWTLDGMGCIKTLCEGFPFPTNYSHQNPPPLHSCLTPLPSSLAFCGEDHFQPLFPSKFGEFGISFYRFLQGVLGVEIQGKLQGYRLVIETLILIFCSSCMYIMDHHVIYFVISNHV